MIKQKYVINAEKEKVWAALVNPEIIKEWTGTSAIMSAQEGSQFKLWDGDIWGTNTRVIDQELLEQDWFGADWPKPSKVVIHIHSTGSSTEIELLHTDFPEKEEQNFADGWRDYYFGSIKKLLEA